MNRYEPLYLKYRPQALGELVGQPAVVRALTNAVTSDRLSHAYLFTGPRGTGKTSTARILAKSVNCQGGPTAEPCLKCASCVEIRECSSLDVIEIDAASNNSVDDARTLIERAPLVAVGGGHKFYIIDECHMLTREAFNALLKTIEEPPARVIFVLATTEEHKVPQTIVSRCQRLMFRLVSQGDLLAHLKTIAGRESIEIEERALELIANRSGGGLRDALGLLDQASLLGCPGSPVTIGDLLPLLGAVQEDVLLEISAGVLERRGDRVLACVNELLAQGREPGVLAQELARHFLHLTKASYVSDAAAADGEGSPLLIGSPGYISGVLDQARRFERAELSQIVERLDRLEQSVRRTTQPGMSLEMGLLSICHRHDIAVVRDLQERLRRLEEALSSGQSLPARAAGPYARSPAQPYARPPAPAPAAAPPAPASEPVDAVAPEPPALEPESSAPPAPAAAAFEPRTAPAAPGEPAPPEPASQITMAGAEEEPEIDLDAFWSQVLDALQRTSIPAYSLLSEHAFPLAVGAKSFTIGVLSDNFQGMVEKRLKKLQSTCEEILGYGVAIKVRVVSDPSLKAYRNKPAAGEAAPAAPAAGGTPEAPSAGREREAESEGAPGQRQQAGGEDGDAESDPARGQSERPGVASRSPAAAERATAAGPPSGQQGVDASAKAADGGPRVISGKAASAVLDDDRTGFSPRTVREAYKLFDGPGSRLIV